VKGGFGGRAALTVEFNVAALAVRPAIKPWLDLLLNSCAQKESP
jgi:hypothetical protein